MTIEEFRRHQYLPSQWRKELAENGILSAVLEVLEESHPSRYPVQTDVQDDLSPTKAALQLGFTRGYSAVLNTIRTLARPLKSATPLPESTYQKPEIEEQPRA